MYLNEYEQEAVETTSEISSPNTLLESSKFRLRISRRIQDGAFGERIINGFQQLIILQNILN